jgi:DNA-binding CsgD family transcriptional regulator
MAATATASVKGRNNREKLAELVADGMTVAEAARSMGVSQTTAFKHWTAIKQGLGAQAV